MSRLVDDGAGFGFQPGGPVYDAGRRDAAFVIKVLVKPPRRVGRIGPGGAHAVESAGNAHLFDHLSLVEDVLIAGDDIETKGIPFEASAVVGGEDDEGIFQFTGALQIFDDSSELLVESIDHRGVDRHTTGKVELAIFGERVPGGIHANLGLAVVPPV